MGLLCGAPWEHLDECFERVYTLAGPSVARHLISSNLAGKYAVNPGRHTCGKNTPTPSGLPSVRMLMFCKHSAVQGQQA